MTAVETRWYPSKVDWWLGAILALGPVVGVVGCVAVALSDKSHELPWAIGGLAFVLAVYGGLVLPTRYGLDGTHLIVRFGLCRKRIALADILDVRPSRSLLSSPALSIDRLAVKFGTGMFGEVLISPADREGFLTELAAQAGLKREGDRLGRA